jgi:hypothetical protein
MKQQPRTTPRSSYERQSGRNLRVISANKNAQSAAADWAFSIWSSDIFRRDVQRLLCRSSLLGFLFLQIIFDVLFGDFLVVDKGL